MESIGLAMCDGTVAVVEMSVGKVAVGSMSVGTVAGGLMGVGLVAVRKMPIGLVAVLVGAVHSILSFSISLRPVEVVSTRHVSVEIDAVLVSVLVSLEVSARRVSVEVVSMSFAVLVWGSTSSTASKATSATPSATPAASPAPSSATPLEIREFFPQLRAFLFRFNWVVLMHGDIPLRLEDGDVGFGDDDALRCREFDWHSHRSHFSLCLGFRFARRTWFR